MSIHKTGPRAYEYQYLATVYFVLSLLKAKKQVTCLKVEAAGSEDAELLVVEQGEHSTLEVQVKTDKENLSLEHLAKILCHFGDHSIDDNLVNRVINGQHKAVVFLTARCSEATEPYLTEADIFGRAHISIPKNIASLIDLISEYRDTSRRYSKDRSSFCKQMSKQLNDPLLQDRLVNNLYIVEKMSREDLFERCQTLLFKTFQVPMLHSEFVMEKLINEIRNGRDSGSDVWKPFYKVLLSNRSGQPDIKSDYYPRIEEADLVKKLSSENSLFLKGPSFCGKSSIAKAIAKAFTDLNYQYEFISDYHQAERFLLASDPSDKICIYDDPLGFLYEEGKSYAYLEKIYQLAESPPPGRKLIATANDDVLRRLKADKHPQWVDASVVDSDQLLDISRSLARYTSAPQAIVERIEQYVLTAEKYKQLQAGQIAYILRNYGQLPGDQDLWSFSALSSKRIQQNLEKRSELAIEVFYTLSLIADTIISVSDIDAAQFYSKEKMLPGIRPIKKGLSIRSFGGDGKADKFPKYKNKGKLSKQIGEEIDFLIKCGYLYDGGNGIQFAHPVYLQAAKDLLKDIQGTAFKRLVASAARGLSLLSVGNAQLAAKALSLLFSCRSKSIERTIIMDLAWEARRSIFPSVSDIGLLFFCDHLSFIRPSDFENLTQALSDYRFEQSETRWHKGIPFITNKTKESRLFDRTVIEDNEYEGYCELLSDPGAGYLVPQDAYKMTRHIKERSRTTPLYVASSILGKLLDYDEAFIRYIASYHVFYQFTAGDEALVTKVCKDQHPIVIVEAIKGLIAGWYRYDRPTRQILLPIALELMHSIPVSIAANHFITQFGAGYSGNSFDWLYNIPKKRHPQMWKLWGKLLVVYFKNVPVEIHFHVHRFVSSLHTALEMLSASENAQILSALIEWMKKSVKFTDYDNILFYVASHYMQIRGKLTTKQRIYFTNELLDTDFPYLALNSARIYAAHWDSLDVPERSIVTSIVKSDKSDLFGSVILTGETVPDELGELVSGYAIGGQIPAEKTTELPIGTVEKCLSILYLTHKLRDLDHSDRISWIKILRVYINKEQEKLRYLAIRVCLEHYAMFGRKEFEEHWGGSLTTFKKIIANPDSKQYLKYLLLDDLCNFTCSNAQPLWTLLNDSFDQGEKKSAMSAIAEKIFYVELCDNLRIVNKVWGKEFYEVQFPHDNMIIELLSTLQEIGIFSMDVIEASFGMIFKAFEQQLPKMIFTYDCLHRFIDNNKVEMEAVYQKITVLRHAHFEQNKGSDRKFKYPAAEEYFKEIYIDLPKPILRN